MSKRPSELANAKANIDVQPAIRKRRITTKSNLRTMKLKQAQPPRPKKPLTFSLPKHLTTSQPATPQPTQSRSSTPTSNTTTTTTTPLIRLHRIQILVNGIHRRNKNQHRAQKFYKHLSILRRCVGKLIILHEDTLSLSQSRGSQPTTAAETRLRFERESHLRGQRELLETYLRETVVPGAWVAFSGVVADVQFANLGVVLLGVLADVVAVVGVMKVRVPGVNASSERGTVGAGGRLVGLSTLVTGPDCGMVVERVYDSEDGGRERGVASRRAGERGAGTELDVGEVVDREDVDVGRVGALATSSAGERMNEDVAMINNDESGTVIDEVSPPSAAHLPAARAKPSPPTASQSSNRGTQPGRTESIPSTSISLHESRSKGSSKESKQDSNAMTFSAKSSANIQDQGASTRKEKAIGKDRQKLKKKKKANAIDDLFSAF